MYKQFVQQKHKVLHTLRQHIALMMLGIFFFPIVFQSMHMMWLSSADIENEHHHCHLAFTQKQATPQSEKVSEEESTCTICTYQYFTNNLPQQLIVTSTEVHLATYFTPIAEKRFYQVISEKMSRAPPSLTV